MRPKETEPTIRLVGPDDLIEVHTLWREAGLPFRPEGRDSVGHLTREIQSGQAFLAGAFDGQVMVGVVLGTSDGRKGWVNRLAVRPAYRHRGVAKALLDFCERRFEGMGVGLTCCLIEEWNESSLQLFQAQGYGLHKDIYYLRKFLSGEDW